MRLLVAFGCAVAFAIVPASAAMAAGTADVRSSLRGLGLVPAPRFPTAVPPRLRGSDAQLRGTESFTVTWDRGTAEDGLPIGFVSLGRAKASQLRSDLATARARGSHPRRVRIGSRRVWRLCGHLCGLEWREQSYTYFLLGIYYKNEAIVARDERTLIASLESLVGS
jgi:hypothetical protein